MIKSFRFLLYPFSHFIESSIRNLEIICGNFEKSDLWGPHNHIYIFAREKRNKLKLQDRKIVANKICFSAIIREIYTIWYLFKFYVYSISFLGLKFQRKKSRKKITSFSYINLFYYQHLWYFFISFSVFW